MKNFFRIFTILTVGVVAALVVIQAGKAAWLDGQLVRIPILPQLFAQQTSVPVDGPTDLLSSACAVKPSRVTNKLRRLPTLRRTLPLTRFRQDTVPVPSRAAPTGATAASFRPREEVVLIHPTNFGRRFLQDVNGNAVANDPIVVLHETVGSGWSTINFFQTNHPYDDDQVSYHTLIREDGTITYLVPPERRAFGAGNSIFRSPNGDEAVKTNPVLPASVNNFAYHISLVTPPDGRDDGDRHGGYTRAQYQSLAWLVAKTGVPESRITTHKAVDRSRLRKDPRSFNWDYFRKLLAQFPPSNDIEMRCTTPAIAQEE
jgi:hypothetical protein